MRAGVGGDGGLGARLRQVLRRGWAGAPDSAVERAVAAADARNACRYLSLSSCPCHVVLPPTSILTPTAHGPPPRRGAALCSESDLEVNPVREKKLSNMRTTGAEEKFVLTPPRLMSLEDAIGCGVVRCGVVRWACGWVARSWRAAQCAGPSLPRGLSVLPLRLISPLDAHSPPPPPAPLVSRYVGVDELIEVTPTKLRLRKRTLESGQRRQQKRREDSIS